MRRYLSRDGPIYIDIEDEIAVWDNISNGNISDISAEFIDKSMIPLAMIIDLSNLEQSEYNQKLADIIIHANDRIVSKSLDDSLILSDYNCVKVDPRVSIVCISSSDRRRYLIQYPYLRSNIDEITDIIDYTSRNSGISNIDLDIDYYGENMIRRFSDWDLVYCVDGNDNKVEINGYFSPSLHLLDLPGLASDNIHCILSANYWGYEFKFNHYLEDDLAVDDLVEFLNLLPRSRIKQTRCLMDIGRIIFNHLRDKHDNVGYGLTLWKRYASHSVHHTLESTWNNFYLEEADPLSRSMTIKTLQYYAREDNRDGYNKIINSKLQDILDNMTINATDGSVARYLYAKYNLDHICVSVKSQEWMIWNKRTHRWDVDHDGNSIHSKLDDLKYIINELSDSKFLDVKKTVKSIRDYSSDLKDINRLLKCLDSSLFRSRVIKYASRLFYDKKFSSLANMNSNLFVCNNCVLEVSGNSITSRPGKPEDYMSKGSNIKYKPLNVRSVGYRSVMDFLTKIFHTKDNIDYIISTTASAIRGSISHRMLLNLIGVGKNGKTLFMKLVRAVFGEYHTVIQKESIMMSRKNPDAPSPGLDSTKYAKIVQYNELSEGDKFDESLVKMLTGGDDMRVRTLYSVGGVYVPRFLLICLSNVPQVMTGEKAIRDRYVAFPCNSVFSDSPPSDEKDRIKNRHYLQDSDMERKITAYASDFLSILVSRFSSKVRIPDDVNEFTSQYWKNSDPYEQYVARNIQILEMAEISYNELYIHFSEWHERNYKKKVIRPTFIFRFTQLLRQDTRYSNVIFDDDKDIAYGITISKMSRKITSLV